ncbi:MAG: Na+-translocating ferredoxin:NAD+ oxidoreductase RnfG subunit, partial [Candidatus Azotimanducaceae bacterium]
SGATITPRAIILAVRQQLEILQQQALNPGNTSLE